MNTISEITRKKKRGLLNTPLWALIIILFFLSTFPILLFSQKLPEPVGYVNDFAGIIDEQSKIQMERIIRAVKEATGAEIAVVTVKTIQPYGSIEEYSIDLATKWGIGEKGKDNGIMIIVAMKERKIRIEVGYGLEGIIPDGLAGEIIDKSILPYLSKGMYGTGLLKGVEAVAGIIAKEYDVDLSKYNLNVEESKKYTRRSGLPIGLISFLILLFLFGGGRFFWPLLFLGGFSSRGFFGGGFGSDGGDSFGGFSGFGGGGFGGGGASRGF